MSLEPKHPVPVFPLPGVVLFPHASLPLHVYELRYRTMVRDALSGERVIALALLQAGWERDYHGSPGFHPIACLARFESVEWLPNDCYDLQVLGLARVRVTRVVRDYPYRAARVQLLPQAPVASDDPLVMLEGRALREAYARLARGGPSGPVPDLPSEVSYEGLVNAVCMALPVPAEEKLALLAEDSVIERGRRARERIEERLRRIERGGAGERN
jgi:Lon protease-like protein